MKLRTEFEGGYSSLIRDVRESAVPVIAIQHVATILRHVQVRETVVVVVAPRAAEAITGTGDCRRLRDVLERAIAVVLVKRVARNNSTLVQVTTVHEINVRIAVAIEICDANAWTEYLSINRNSIVASEMDKLDSGGCAYVGELYGSGHCLPIKVSTRIRLRKSDGQQKSREGEN